MGEKGRWRQEKGMVEPGGGEGEKRGRKGVRKGGREGGRASVCHSTVKAYFTQMTAYIQNVSAVCCSLHHIQLASAQQQLEQARIVQVGYTKPPCVRTTAYILAWLPDPRPRQLALKLQRMCKVP